MMNWLPSLFFLLIHWAPPTAAQQPDSPEALARRYAFLLEAPTAERVFRVESEAELISRLQKEQPTRADRIDFPKTTLPPQPSTARVWSPQAIWIAPNYVCYRPLYFEDKNTERYGWDGNVFQPLVSAGKFYLDLGLLPYQLVVLPPCACECSTGYLLPGDPLPFMIYGLCAGLPHGAP